MIEFITDLNALREPAQPVILTNDDGLITGGEGQELMDKLNAAFAENPELSAISAPQIGIKKRIFGIKFGSDIKYFINPILTRKGAPIILYEELKNLPGKEIAIIRPKEVEIKYYNEQFKYEDNKLLDVAAALFDQQYQILDGIIPGEALKLFEEPEIKLANIPLLISAEYSGGGILVDIQEDSDRLTTDELQDVAKILSAYMEKFSLIGNSLKNADDITIRYTYKNLKFAEDVILGKIEVIEQEPEKPALNRSQRRALAKGRKNRK